MSKLRKSQAIAREVKEKLVERELLSPRDTLIPQLSPEGASWYIALKIHLECVLNKKVSPSVERTGSHVQDISPFFSTFYNKVKQYTAPSELMCEKCHKGLPVVDIALYESSIVQEPIFAIKLCVPTDKLQDLKEHYQAMVDKIRPRKQDSIEMLFNSFDVEGKKKKN